MKCESSGMKMASRRSLGRIEPEDEDARSRFCFSRSRRAFCAASSVVFAGLFETRLPSLGG
jgi:hypothetical protein